MDRKLQIKKMVIILIILNLIQIGALIAVLLYASIINRNSAIPFKLTGENLFFLIIIVTTLLSSFISIRDINIMVRFHSQYRLLEETYEKVDNLNKTLRAQRHDFMNHLQVVYSLMEMDEFVDAKDYIEKVYNDIQKVSRILKTSNAAVNALLQAKMLDCEKHDINTNIIVTTKLDDLKIPSWELCRVLGNIIDNARDALMEVKTEKILKIELFEDLKSFGFRIKDNGPVIPMNIQKKIFEPGFTTKGDKGEGMGLAISNDIIKAYCGNINVISNENETVFEGLIPR